MKEINVRETAFLFFLLLSVATLPYSLRVNSLSIVGLALAWIAREPVKDIFQRLKRPLLLLFVSFFLLYVIGLLWTENIHQGRWELEKKLGLIIFPLILGTTKPLSKESIKKLLSGYVLMIILASVVCIGYGIYRVMKTGNFSETDPTTLYTTHYLFYDGLAEILIQPMYLAAYVVFSIIIVWSRLLDEWFELSRQKKIGIILVFVYLTVFLIMLSARIMIIAWFILMVSNTIFRTVMKGKTAFGLVTSLVIIVVMAGSIYFVPVLRSRFLEVIHTKIYIEKDPEANKHLAGKLNDVNMRLAKWYYTVEAGKGTWLVGAGTGDDMDVLLKKYLDNNFMEGYVPQYNSHNQYLQTWLALGAVGVLLMLSNLFVPMYLAFRKKNLLYLTFLALIIMFCCTESIFSRQYGVVFYAFFNSLFAFHSLNQES